MNHKIVLFAILTFSLIFSSCNKSSDLSDVIPADASYVANIDLKSAIEKSNYDIFKNPTLQKGISVYKAFLNDEAQVKMIDDFLKDANYLGLNLKDEVYMYTNYNVFGLVLGVKDSKVLAETLVKLSLVKEGNIKKDGDIQLISPESMATIAWDNHRFIVLIDLKNAYEIDTQSSKISIEEQAKQQLKQRSDKSINSNKAFAEFKNNKKDFSIFYTFNGLDKLKFDKNKFLPGVDDLKFMMKVSGVDDLASMMPVFGELEGLSTGIFTSFENGEISLNTKYYYDTPEVEAKYKALVNNVSGTLSGKYMKYITSDPLFMFSVNIKGDGMYHYFLDSMMNKKVDGKIQPEKIEKIIKSINGDVTFALTSINKEARLDAAIPECLFFADIANPADVASIIKEEFENFSVKYTEIKPSVFLIEQNSIKIYLGVNNNTFFLTNIESVYNNLNTDGLKNNYSDLIRDKIAVVYGDFASVRSVIKDQRDLAYFSTIIQDFKNYQAAISAIDFSTQGKIELDTKDKNSLAVICQQIDQMLTNLSSSFGL